MSQEYFKKKSQYFNKKAVLVLMFKKNNFIVKFQDFILKIFQHRNIHSVLL